MENSRATKLEKSIIERQWYYITSNKIKQKYRALYSLNVMQLLTLMFSLYITLIIQNPSI